MKPFKCRKIGKIKGRRSANEAMVENFLNGRQDNLILDCSGNGLPWKRHVYVKEGMVISETITNDQRNALIKKELQCQK